MSPIKNLAFLVSLFLAVPLWGAEAGSSNQSAVDRKTEAIVTVENRPVVTLRSTVLGIDPQERAERAAARIEKQLLSGGPHTASVADLPPGKLIQIDGAGSFYIAPTDIDPFQQETLDDVSQKAATNLALVIAENRESRSLDYMARAGGSAVLLTAIYVFALWLVGRMRREAQRRIELVADSKIDQLNQASLQILNRNKIQWILNHILRAIATLVIVVLSYEWIGHVLELFPITRSFGENLNSYFAGLVSMLGTALLKTIPDLIIAVLIFVIASATNKILGSLFARVADGSVRLGWLDADSAAPTRRITTMAVWLFALAMAYAYLPGANTEAFKGLSVLAGLMISLGASGLVGQVVSGLILTYTGIFRKGEFIQILDYKGSIVEMGMFSTRIRDGMGVEMTLPNALVLSNVTQNYSKAVEGHGFIVDTKVTIGYDTPWRQVEQMLIDAALRTPGIIADPKPKVFQTALSDFYPEYLLICQAVPSDAQLRAEVLNQLHAHIQDVFNEYGVQIMSPNYLGDPANEKIVAKQDWYRAPASKVV